MRLIPLPTGPKNLSESTVLMLFKPWTHCLNLGIGCRDIADFGPAVAPPCSSAAPSCDELFRDLMMFRNGLLLFRMPGLFAQRIANWLTCGLAPLQLRPHKIMSGPPAGPFSFGAVLLWTNFSKASLMVKPSRLFVMPLSSWPGSSRSHVPMSFEVKPEHALLIFKIAKIAQFPIVLFDVVQPMSRRVLRPRAYVDLAIWHDAIRPMRWTSNMISRAIPALRCPEGTLAFLVIHLFSGRRRETDCHSWLKEWARSTGRNVIVLSMDTAVSSHYGNLDKSSSSRKILQQLYRGGYVSAS